MLALRTALSIIVAPRRQVRGDQHKLPARGWLFTRGKGVRIGMITSSDGKTPGGAVALLAAVPLLL